MPRQVLTGRLRHKVRVAIQIDLLMCLLPLLFFIARSSWSSLLSTGTLVGSSPPSPCAPRT
eukprot:5939124-Amphidinium_carterae.1